MNCLRVGGAGQEGATGREAQGEDGDCPLESSSQLVQLGPVPGVKHPDDRALGAGGGHPAVCPGQCDGGQLTLMGGDDHATLQCLRIKDLQLARVAVTRVGQETPVRGVSAQGQEASGVGRGAADDVDHLHVSDVVDVETLLQTHHQSLQTPILTTMSG